MTHYSRKISTRAIFFLISFLCFDLSQAFISNSCSFKNKLHLSAKRQSCYSGMKPLNFKMAMENLDYAGLFSALHSTTHLIADSAFHSTTNLIAEESTYSKASYYTTLGLYLISFPGLYSLVKRSVKASNVQKTYEVPGPALESGAKQLKQTAAEIMAYFTANNYKIEDASEVISFRGKASKSVSQAFFLSFCTFIGMGSLALVLSIQFQEIGSNFFYITLLAPYAGLYYWRNADRDESAKVKLVMSDDEKSVDVIVEGSKDELERFARTLKFQEKGMVYVKGIFE